jgi:hypothetical protein
VILEETRVVWRGFGLAAAAGSIWKEGSLMSTTTKISPQRKRCTSTRLSGPLLGDARRMGWGRAAVFRSLLACFVAAGAACSSGSGGEAGTGGQGGSNSGGTQASGGTTSAGSGGGTSGSGGSGATGGTPATGGTGTGGRVGTGGSRGTGGSQGSGGTRSGAGGADTGGTTGTGGAAGGRSGTGGTSAAGGTAGRATGGTPGTGGAGGLACASTLAAVTDYSAAGPFATTTENNTGPDAKSVIYRPRTLGENGFLHAPIIFGPGIGMQASQLSGLLLSFASHGYVVVGTAVLNGGPNDPANKATMQNALTWIIQQNDKTGTYQGKIATKCAISMGYSVGGTAAVEIGGDPAVATVVSIHGHKATAALHGTMLQTSGTNDTVGLPMQQYTFDNSKVQTFMGTVSGADHGYIQQATGGVQRPAIIAWMRYWINGDTGAKSYFYGDDCVMCKSPWTNPQRKNWQ